MIPWLPDDSDSAPFPSTRLALGPDSEAPGLLCAGGQLSVARLRMAYRLGIFPWYSQGQPVLWWSTDPRMVLQVAQFKLHRSLKKTLRRFLATPGNEVRIDSAFADVIDHCSHVPREGQDGTWIVPEVKAAYVALHHAGSAHSFEAWVDGELVGGLYGVCVGRMFYGESMFARRTDASKIALAALVAFCLAHGISWIDCQMETAHLASLGAQPVPRAQFEAHLSRVVDLPAPKDWFYDPSSWARLGDRGPGQPSPSA